MGPGTFQGIRDNAWHRVRPLRILHVDSGTSWRGGQRQALLLALGLRQAGHEPLLIGPPDSPLVTRARAAGLAVATVRMRGDWDVAAAKRIRARLRTWRADIIHAHDARSHAVSLLALIGQPATPLIVTRRVPFAPKAVRIKYGGRVTRFIAISRAVRDAMVARGIAADRIDVVHSGVAPLAGSSPARDWRSELGWPADAVVCGIVGAMTIEKGIDMLAEIARQLPVESAKKARLVLLGPGAEGTRMIGPITAHAAGFVDDIGPAIAGLDVLWHPSRAEGLGTSVIDAMTLGVPPIAFATGGLPEVIAQGSSGMLVNLGDTASFAAAAARLIDDPIERALLAEGARTRAKSFTAASMIERTELVYQSVLAG